MWPDIVAIYRASKKKQDINWFTEHVARPPAAVVVYALPASFRGGESSGGASPGAVDGLLGRDVLDAFTLSVDSASGRATLTVR